MPTIPTLWPGPIFQWRSGDQVVIPAQSKGATAASCSSEWRILQHELLVDGDALRIAAERMAGRIRSRAVIGADQALLAILLEALVAGRAIAAASDHAADPDRVADREAGHLGADRADMSDDFVAGHAGIERAAPFGADRVQVRMADAAIFDLDLNILGPGSRRSMSIGSSGLSAAWAP